MRFKQYLNEKTYAIGADVDLIYKKFLKKPLMMVKKGDIKGFLKFVKDHKMFETSKDSEFGTMMSFELKSKKSKEASKINPVYIIVGIFDSASYYNPLKKQISISLNLNAFNLLKDVPYKKIKYELPDNDTWARFQAEFTEANIKGTIYHELSHWLNDTLHNQNIKKRLDKAHETGKFGSLKKFGTDLFTDYELDAQVHAIKQLKRNYKKDWDKLTWNDIEKKKVSFYVIKKALKNASKIAQDDYMKRMLKRLNREKLLGKGLKNSFKKWVNK